MMTRVPRYHRIAQSLREQIGAGALQPGERLGTQRGLARQFGVTLMTLRQALTVLEREGLIARRHGLGTFVAAASVDYDILHWTSLAGDLTAKGQEVVTRFVRSGFVRADAATAKALRLGDAGRAFVLERLRLVDGHPMSFQASYLAPALGAEVAKVDLSVTPLGAALADKLGIDVLGAHETVSAVPLDPHAARHLGCRAGVAAFRSDRVSLGSDGAAVVYDRVFIPGDRFRITRELHYQRSHR
jgi:GntR family transcriptional regulator